MRVFAPRVAMVCAFAALALAAVSSAAADDVLLSPVAAVQNVTSPVLEAAEPMLEPVVQAAEPVGDAAAPVVEAAIPVVGVVEDGAAPVVAALQPAVEVVQPASDPIEPAAAQDPAFGGSATPADPSPVPVSPTANPSPDEPVRTAEPALAPAGQAPSFRLAEPLVPPPNGLHETPAWLRDSAVAVSPALPAIPSAETWNRPAPASPSGNTLATGLSIVTGTSLAPMLLGLACAALLALVAPGVVRRLAVSATRPPRQGFVALLERPG